MNPVGPSGVLIFASEQMSSENTQSSIGLPSHTEMTRTCFKNPHFLWPVQCPSRRPLLTLPVPHSAKGRGGPKELEPF